MTSYRKEEGIITKILNEDAVFEENGIRPEHCKCSYGHFSEKCRHFDKISENIIMFEQLKKKEELKRTKSLFIDIEFNEVIEEYPKNIRGICYKNYSKEIKNLPDSIEYIYLYNYKKTQLELKEYPPNLKIFMISGEYNFSLDNLPSTIKYLSLIDIITDYGINNLPIGLEHLNIDISDDTPKFNLYYLPETLISCCISTSIEDINIDTLPQKLKKLTIRKIEKDYKCEYLPEGLEEININCENANMLNLSRFKELKKLTVSSRFEINLDELSEKIEEIKGGYLQNFETNKKFNNLIKIENAGIMQYGEKFMYGDEINDSLQKIEIDLDNIFPNLLIIKNIWIPSYSKITKLPSKLKKLDIDGYFDMEIKDLPITLEYVRLPRTFNLYFI